jgi:small-conductance mechanosensitive channel
MKKIDLIHTTILIVAILAGYSAISNAVSLVAMLAYMPASTYARDNVGSEVIIYLVIVALFAGISVILVRKGRNYASAILKNEPEGSADDPAQLVFSRQDIILVLLIGIGLYTLIQSIPYAITDLATMFKDKVANQFTPEPKSQTKTIAIELLKITIGIFIIYAAPALTNFINRRIAAQLDSDPKL